MWVPIESSAPEGYKAWKELESVIQQADGEIGNLLRNRFHPMVSVLTRSRRSFGPLSHRRADGNRV